MLVLFIGEGVARIAGHGEVNAVLDTGANAFDRPAPIEEERSYYRKGYFVCAAGTGQKNPMS